MNFAALMVLVALVFASVSSADSLVRDCTYSLHELSVTKRTLQRRQPAPVDTSYTWICDTLVDGIIVPLIPSYGEIIPFTPDSIRGRRGFPDTSTMRSAYGIDSLTGRLWIISEQGETLSIPPVLHNDSLIYDCFEIELVGITTGHTFHLDLFAFWDDTVDFDYKFDSLVTRFGNSVDIVGLSRLKGVYVRHPAGVNGGSGRPNGYRGTSRLTPAQRSRAQGLFDVAGRSGAGMVGERGNSTRRHAATATCPSASTVTVNRAEPDAWRVTVTR